MIRFGKPTLADVQHVTTYVSENDRIEIQAASFNEWSPNLLASSVYLVGQSAPLFECCWLDSEPVCIALGTFLTPTNIMAHHFGTDKFKDVALSINRRWRKVTCPDLAAFGISRVECRALSSRLDVHGWLVLLGFEHECDIPLSGAKMEDFMQFSKYLPCA